jgi:hypothetical protein
MQRADYTRIKSHVFDVLQGYNSPYQETKKMCVQSGLPFGIREEQMVSNAISEFHGWREYVPEI